MNDSTNTTSVIVSGAYGRMGQAIWKLASSDADITIAGGLERLIDPTFPRPSGITEEAPIADNLAGLNAPVGSVVIEFTSPEATLKHAKAAAELRLPIVVGTTGLSSDQHAVLAEVAKQIPVLIAANMSVGVNVLLDIVSRLAKTLPNYDIEIVEMHHRLKVDAPSGTALALARAAADGLGETLEDVAVHGRTGETDKRPERQIGIHAVRGGDVVGDHTVMFAGLGERIEVVHKASSRDTFAAGAIRAAKFLSGKPAGLYTMKDALGL